MVSNFVSGIILLAERPIRVGDWVVVKSEEGIVRRISVRATEIETFDRASVIIPNSEFITGAVKNLTHSDTMGRVTVKLRVAFDSDVEAVRDILVSCAGDHPQVLQTPPPRVYLIAFGDIGLELELRFIVANVNYSLTVKSEIQMVILQRLRAAGIKIPVHAARGTAAGRRAAAGGRPGRLAHIPAKLTPGSPPRICADEMFIFRLRLRRIVPDPIRSCPSMIRPSATVLIGALAVALAACAGERRAAGAADLLPQHGEPGGRARRRRRGLDDLRLPAEQRPRPGHARSGADADGRRPRRRRWRRATSSTNDAKGEFAKRMKAAGFDAKVSVENISAGYHTLAEAFSGWRDSPPHRANMLKAGVSRIGIAAVYTPSSKYKVYWALILAAPEAS